MKNVFIINGSASEKSSNQKLIEVLVELSKEQFKVTIFDQLKSLPHFDPELSELNTPESILHFRKQIEKADGVIICTPEYVFSIPSGLKNAIEWCVSTMVFSNKPTGLITASASGVKGQEELKLIMHTLMTNITDETTLLIQGVKGKFNEAGELKDAPTKSDLLKFIEAFDELIPS